jgi:hypothetical protein
MWAPTTGSWPPWTLPTIAEPGVVEGVVGLVVLVVPVKVMGFSWNDPQPHRSVAAKRDARQT